jgi:uncharacterized protein
MDLFSQHQEFFNKPIRLTQDETQSPEQIFHNFYGAYHLHELREKLWQLVETGLTSDNPYFEEPGQRDHLMWFYNQLEQLLEAGFLISKSSKAAIKRDDTKRLASKYQNIVDFLILMIKPERVFRVILDPKSDIASNDEVDLIIVIPNTDQRPFSEFDTIIQVALMDCPNVNFSVHQSTDLYNKVQAGHIFYSLACTPQSVVHDDGTQPLPATDSSRLVELKQKAVNEFWASYSKAKAFFVSSTHHLENGNPNIAAFMLHQASELTFRAIITSLLGVDRRSHSILELQKYCRRAAKDLTAVFPGNTQFEKNLIMELDNAYLGARYNVDYSIEVEIVKLLSDRVQRLMSKALEVFEGRLLVVDSFGDVTIRKSL